MMTGTHEWNMACDVRMPQPWPSAARAEFVNGAESMRGLWSPTVKGILKVESIM